MLVSAYPSVSRPGVTIVADEATADQVRELVAEIGRACESRARVIGHDKKHLGDALGYLGGLLLLLTAKEKQS